MDSAPVPRPRRGPYLGLLAHRDHGQQAKASEDEPEVVPRGPVKTDRQVHEKEDKGQRVAGDVQRAPELGAPEGQTGVLAVAAVDDRGQLEQERSLDSVPVAPSPPNQPLRSPTKSTTTLISIGETLILRR